MSVEIKVLKNYEGSAVKYIDNYIIPYLPKSETVIEFTKGVYDYLNDFKNIRYVRRFGKYKFRGTIYSDISPFTVCDNEPALWFFMECYEKKVKGFQSYHNERLFPVAFVIKKEELSSLDSHFNYGKKKRENSFSDLGLKHCHILDCSPKNLSLNDLSIESRMLRFVSPINHFHFPAPGKYEMQGAYKNDWGEDQSFIGLVKKRLYESYYSSNYEKEFIMDYYKKCNADTSEMNFLNLKDFDINFQLKSDLPNKNKVKKIISRPKNISDSILEKKNFILKKSYYGHNYTIKFIDKYDTIIEYNHDLVLDQLNERIKKLPCWEKYGYYTNSKKLPKFVEGLESVIIND